MKSQLKFAIAIIVVLSSCATIRQQHQSNLDKKAVGRVLANTSLIDQVYAVALGLHPISSNPVLIKGKDSIVYNIDTLIVDHEKDSIIMAACPNLNLDSFRLANTITKTINHYRVDTLPVKDTLCQRQYELLNNDKNILQGKFDQQTVTVSAVKKASSKKTWIIVGLVALIVIYSVFKLYTFIRKG